MDNHRGSPNCYYKIMEKGILKAISTRKDFKSVKKLFFREIKVFTDMQLLKMSRKFLYQGIIPFTFSFGTKFDYETKYIILMILQDLFLQQKEDVLSKLPKYKISFNVFYNGTVDNDNVIKLLFDVFSAKPPNNSKNCRFNEILEEIKNEAANNKETNKDNNPQKINYTPIDYIKGISKFKNLFNQEIGSEIENNIKQSIIEFNGLLSNLKSKEMVFSNNNYYYRFLFWYTREHFTLYSDDNPEYLSDSHIFSHYEKDPKKQFVFFQIFFEG